MLLDFCNWTDPHAPLWKRITLPQVQWYVYQPRADVSGTVVLAGSADCIDRNAINYEILDI